MSTAASAALVRLLCGINGAQHLVARRRLFRAVDRAGLTAKDMAA